MFEMPKTREDHRNIMFIRGFDWFIIFDRTAGLNDRRNAEARGFIHIIAEREKRVGRERGIF